MINDQKAKEQAYEAQMLGIGQPAVPNRARHREMRIESLEGGFVVGTQDEWNAPVRRVMPNADCLLSFVQKWTAEGQQGG